jgi:hypothetical protein
MPSGKRSAPICTIRKTLLLDVRAYREPGADCALFALPLSVINGTFDGPPGFFVKRGFF